MTSKINKASRWPLWLIAKYENCRMRVLTTGADKGETLPIFSFEEEAESFLGLAAPGSGWRIEVTTPEELTSVLLGPYADVQKVALDPLPVADSAVVDLVSLDRERFVRNLLDESR